MKRIWILLLLACLAFTGCGGGDPGANKDLDRPKKEKDKPK